jgi:succinate-acetate transporter protein
MTTPQAAPAGGGVDSALAEALGSPDKGKGYFYAVTASGTPLALLSFGIAFLMLSFANAEVFDKNALGIMTPIAVVGAIGLIVAGLWDFRAGAGFSATWEILYGALWVFVALFVNNVGDIIAGAAGSTAQAAGAAQPTPAMVGAAAEGVLNAFGAYLFVFAAVTLMFTVGTWFIAKPAFVAFGLTAIAFILLGFANTSTPGSDTASNMTNYGGYVGIAASIVVLYLAFALILNDHLGRQLMPIFPYGV